MPPSRASPRAILAIMASSAVFVTNDACVKIVAHTYPLGEALFVRGLVVTALVAVLVVSFGHLSRMRGGLNPLVLIRGVLEGLAAVTFTSALMHMPIAELTAVTLTSPLIITAMSVVLLNEVVGWRRWTAIGVGFVGALVMVKPTPSAFDAWALLGILCAVVSASRDLLTRRLDPRIPTIVISFTTAVMVTLAGAVLGIGEEWRAMGAAEIGLLAIAGLCLMIGNILLVVAFRAAEVSTLAPFRYVSLFWAGLAGYLAFGDLPDRWAILGGTLIAASGLYALHRERVRGRPLAGATPDKL